jgi:hypothetical protein
MNLVDKLNDIPSFERFNNLPIRIFLDTNIVQYLCDFGEFIFENHMEEDELMTSNRKIIPKDSFLYGQITCLRKIFFAIDRSPFHFAVSEFTFAEVQKKQDPRMTKWFFDLWDYWQTVILESHEDAFSGYGRRRLSQLQSDRSIKSGLSTNDFKVLSDALELECDAVLTCDKYRNRQTWVYDKYKIMLLYPSDMLNIIQPFQAIWC